MPVIELRTLGRLDLHSAEGRELNALLAQPKRIALLVYLCIAQPRGFHRRDTLLGLFWPDADQEHARTSLRKSLHILRRALGEAAILSRGDEEVAADPHLISCDAVTFEANMKANRLEEAMDLYLGDLLAGFFIDEAPEFDRWLNAERRRLRASAARAAGALSDQLAAGGKIPAAVTWAQRALELAETDERALNKLLELQGRSGDRTGAVQSYETFARHLAAEYQTEPSAETRSLIERIRSGKESFGGDAKEAFGRETEVKVPAQTSLLGGQVSPSTTPSLALRVENEKAHAPRARWVRFALAVLAVVVSATALWGWTRPTPSKQVLRYTLTIDSAEAIRPLNAFSGRVAISPDGSRFAYVGGPYYQVLMRLRNELHATAMPGTEGAATPFFSPDGKSVGFLKEKSVWIAPLTGGPPIHVSDSLTGVAGASWGSDGFIYTNGSEVAPLARVEARQGAVPKWFTALDTAK
jgi:DNA-binding SARP family transcriptional activator